MRLLAAVALLATISAWASAQRMSGFAPRSGVPAAPGFTGLMGSGFASNGYGRSGFAHGGHGFPGGFAIPLFSDALYSDLLATGYPSASQPPVFVMQMPPTNAMPATSFFPAPEPALMFELQGDRYVQVSGTAKSDAEMQTLDRATVATTSPRPVAGSIIRASQKEPLYATLVYRDGHREDVSDYTIANGELYAKADYYKSGAWNRKIQLSSLDLPETVQLNQARGLNFQLPSSPNEVIVGP